MSRYQGYSDTLEVMIDVLNELRAIKELLTPKESIEEVNHEQKLSSIQGKQHNTTSGSRIVDKSVGKRGAVQPHKRVSKN